MGGAGGSRAGESIWLVGADALSPPGESLDPEAGKDTDSWTLERRHPLWRAEVASGMVGWKAGAGGEVKENEIRPEGPAQGSCLLGKEYGCDELRGKRVPVSSQPNMSNGGPPGL